MPEIKSKYKSKLKKYGKEPNKMTYAEILKSVDAVITKTNVQFSCPHCSIGYIYECNLKQTPKGTSFLYSTKVILEENRKHKNQTIFTGRYSGYRQYYNCENIYEAVYDNCPECFVEIDFYDVYEDQIVVCSECNNYLSISKYGLDTAEN